MNQEKWAEGLKGTRPADLYHLGQGPEWPIQTHLGQLPALKGLSLKKEGQVALRATGLGYKEIT